MSAKRYGLILGAVLLMGAGLYLAMNASRGGEGQGARPPIRVGRSFWPGMYWSEVAAKKGWFAEAGLNVVLVDTNKDYYGSLRDTAEGRLDIQGFTLFDVMSFNAAGTDLVMVINADNSFGMDAIVAREGIESVSDLAGGTVGVGVGTYTEYILDVVLERGGVPPDAVRRVDVGGEAAKREFVKGELDAVVTWEPYVSEVVAAGGRKLFDTSELPGLSPNGQAVRRSFLRKREEEVAAYVRVWLRTSEYMRTHPEEAYAIIAGIYGTTPEQVSDFARRDKIQNLHDNKVAFTFAAGFESLHGSARWINKFLIRHGITREWMDTTEFIDGRFIRHLRLPVEAR